MFFTPVSPAPEVSILQILLLTCCVAPGIITSIVLFLMGTSMKSKNPIGGTDHSVERGKRFFMGMGIFVFFLSVVIGIVGSLLLQMQ